MDRPLSISFLSSLIHSASLIIFLILRFVCSWHKYALRSQTGTLILNTNLNSSFKFDIYAQAINEYFDLVFMEISLFFEPIIEISLSKLRNPDFYQIKLKIELNLHENSKKLVKI